MTNANDAAFPVLSQTESAEYWNTVPGLTKREHFAGLALQGLLSNSDSLRELRKESGDDWEKYNALVGAFCTNMADALIELLNKPTK